MYSPDLGRLERLLRPAPNFDQRREFPPKADLPSFADHLAAPPLHMSPSARARQPAQGWGVSLVLAVGGTTLLSGLLLLVAANLLLHAPAWRWGFATTLAGQGLLTCGMAAMATRLWRNSRRVNRQLESLDQRLDDVQQSIASTAASATEASLLRPHGRSHRVSISRFSFS